MAQRLTLTLWAGEPRQADDLCPECYLPSLVQFPSYVTTNGGEPHDIYRLTLCVDCGYRTREAI